MQTAAIDVNSVQFRSIERLIFALQLGIALTTNEKVLTRWQKLLQDYERELVSKTTETSQTQWANKRKNKTHFAAVALCLKCKRFERHAVLVAVNNMRMLADTVLVLSRELCVSVFFSF